MTVAQLIAELSKYPAEAEVSIDAEDYTVIRGFLLSADKEELLIQLGYWAWDEFTPPGPEGMPKP
jgi:hypothetical protein